MNAWHIVLLSKCYSNIKQVGPGKEIDCSTTISFLCQESSCLKDHILEKKLFVKVTNILPSFFMGMKI